MTRLLRLALLSSSLTIFAVGTAHAFNTSLAQANNPQVSGVPASNSTAVFPTNKQNEPTIAVNPKNENVLIAGSNDEQRQPPCGPGDVRGAVPASDCSFFPGVGTSGIYTSSDGGVTWTNRGLLDDQASWRASDLVSDGDPVIVYGPRPSAGGGFSSTDMRAYYATLASYKPGRSPYPPNKAPELLAVSYSDDDGATWSTPVIATVKKNPNDFNDKEALNVDTSSTSPYFGRVYISWTEFRSAGGEPAEPVMIAMSTNGGLSFSAPKQVTPAGNNVTGNGRQGSAIAVGPDGGVYVAFEQANKQMLAISRNGGGTWLRPVTIGAVADIADPIPGANFRTDSFPSIAADPRSTSTTLYASWVNKTPAGGRVVVSTSTNKGSNWSIPVEVSTSLEGYAFFQGLDVAPNGRVDIGYQTLIATNPNTYGTGNAAAAARVKYLMPGAANWNVTPTVTTGFSDVAASAQNNLARQFMGDYNTMTSGTGAMWFVFTDAFRGLGCPAVDAYQHAIDGTATVRGDMKDRIATRLGQNPYSHEPGSKPAPPEHCPPDALSGRAFGNTDIMVLKVAP